MSSGCLLIGRQRGVSGLLDNGVYRAGLLYSPEHQSCIGRVTNGEFGNFPKGRKAKLKMTLRK